MIRIIRNTFITITLIFISITSYSQNQDIIHITGRIIDDINRQPVEYATIRLYNNNDSLISGTISDGSGKFNLESRIRNFILKIDFLGYSQITLTDYVIVGNRVDLKTIELRSTEMNLKDVVIRAEKSQTIFKMDKRIFNVGQDLISAGGSALDVLNNVPSVNVNIEGTISLRGNSNVLILINDKPSVLTDGNSLGTITAEMIEQVEVITNPSAKYDAEGTSGIINIILKKEDKRGTNGAVTVNTGIPHNHSIGVSLNHRTEKFNLFSQIGAGYRRFLSRGNSVTIDNNTEFSTSLYTDETGEKNEQFYNIILGTDYHINNLNMITLSGHLGYEVEDENADINYNNYENDIFINKTNRNELTEAVNPKMEYRLNYERSFERDDKQRLTAGATGSYFGKDKSSDYQNTDISGDDEVSKQRSSTNFYDVQYNFTTDYIHPFTKKTILETGAKYEISKLINDYTLSDLNDSTWINNPNFTNEFEYKRNIAAWYATFAHEINNVGFKAGLRIENTNINTLLHNTDEENNQNYTDAFPSFHTTYKIEKGFSLQAGYSRRISRPGMWEINPFFSLRDEYNIQTGNPNLQPEYTNSFELTTIRIWKSAAINGSLYHNRTQDVISEIIKVSDNITYTTFENVGRSYNTGIELNAKTEPYEWISIMVDGNMNWYNRNGNYEDMDFDFNSHNWSGRLTMKLKMPLDTDIEFRGRHHSDYKDFQSIHKAQSMLDIGLRKKFMKGRAVINLSINDVFNSRKRTTITETNEFYRFDESQRSGRRIILGLSFGFGKGEAMEFSGQKIF